MIERTYLFRQFHRSNFEEYYINMNLVTSVKATKPPFDSCYTIVVHLGSDEITMHFDDEKEYEQTLYELIS